MEKCPGEGYAKDLYKKALDKWGPKAQLLIAAEECAELIQAVTKYVNGRGFERDVIEEMADVDIMMEQMKEMLVYSDEQNRLHFMEEKQRKLSRLSLLLEDETGRSEVK